MKHIKTPKFPKASLGTILWSIFIFAVLTEVFILYKYLYLNTRQLPELPVTPTVQIDKKTTAEAKSWFEENLDYQPPAYQLQQSESLGRENPFAQY